eukprot:2843123-Pleurochrysis_carterae.AAC.1
MTNCSSCWDGVGTLQIAWPASRAITADWHLCASLRMPNAFTGDTKAIQGVKAGISANVLLKAVSPYMNLSTFLVVPCWRAISSPMAMLRRRCLWTSCSPNRDHRQ